LYLALPPRLRYHGGVKLRTLLSGIVLATFAAAEEELCCAIPVGRPR
jgi:hypothetical protein